MASTASAVEKYLDACRAAILKANTRTDDEALEMSTNVTETNATATGVFSIQSDVGGQTVRSIDMTCPTCQSDTSTQYAECCGNGRCENSTCVCNEGRFKTELTVIIITQRGRP